MESERLLWIPKGGAKIGCSIGGTEEGQKMSESILMFYAFKRGIWETVERYARLIEGNKRFYISIVDDSEKVQDQKDNRCYLKGLKRQYDITIYHFDRDHQEELFNKVGKAIKSYFFELDGKTPRRSYSTKLNKGFILGRLLGAKRIHFFDEDTGPSDEDIIERHERILDVHDDIVAVTGRYHELDPGPLTTAMFRSGEGDTFIDLIRKYTYGDVDPRDQAMIAGVCAIKAEFCERFALPLLPFAVFTDDVFLAKMVRRCGKEIWKSYCRVRHYHTAERREPQWVKRYLSERLARTVAFWAFVDDKRIIDGLKKVIECGDKPISDDSLNTQRPEVMVRGYGKELATLAAKAAPGLEDAVKGAAEVVVNNAKQICDKIKEEIKEYSEFLVEWKGVMGNIAKLSTRQREELANRLDP